MSGNLFKIKEDIEKERDQKDTSPGAAYQILEKKANKATRKNKSVFNLMYKK